MQKNCEQVKRKNHGLNLDQQISPDHFRENPKILEKENYYKNQR